MKPKREIKKRKEKTSGYRETWILTRPPHHVNIMP